MFEENEIARTQEFVLRWSADGGSTVKEIVRQQWNFSPPDSIREVEEYRAEFSGITVLELVINPNIGGGIARASLKNLRLSRWNASLLASMGVCSRAEILDIAAAKHSLLCILVLLRESTSNSLDLLLDIKDYRPANLSSRESLHGTERRAVRAASGWVANVARPGLWSARRSSKTTGNREDHRQ